MQVDFAVCMTRHALGGGGYLAQLTLNAPLHLNAITPEMASILCRQLTELQRDADAVAVFLDGAGERAFCVGADARRMLDSALSNPGGAAVEAENFIANEFSLAYTLHHFPKPVICWAHGLVMGSGLGFLAAASHRITTHSSVLSLPEVRLGLIPNAGAGWYLNQMPGHSGLFAGLSAVELTAADAMYAGLADYCFVDEAKTAVLGGLLELDWDDDPDWNRRLLTEFLTDLEVEEGGELPPSKLKLHRSAIDTFCGHVLQSGALDVSAFHTGDEWGTAAVVGLSTAAASSQRLLISQLGACRGESLAEVLRLELILMANRIRDPEFAEGVRARLLDRDRDPRWCYASLNVVPQSEIDSHFSPPWTQHPLAELGTTAE